MGQFAIYEVERRYDLDVSDVHIDAALSNILINYRPQGFIADKILPIVPVGKQSDRFFKVDQGDRFRTADDYRAPGTEPNIITFNVSSDGFYCQNYALGTYATTEELANQDLALDVMKIRGELVMDILNLNYERRVALAVTSTSNVGSSTTTGSAWGTSNADPYKDTATDIAVLEDISGYKPNTMVMGRYAWRKFRDSEKVQGLLFPHGGGIPTVQQVSQLLEIENVLIGGAYYNTAAEGATKSLSQIWNDNVLYCYVPPGPSKEVPTYGYSFRWTVPGLPNLIARVFPMDTKKGRQDIHVGMYQDEKLIDTSLGFLRTGVGSSQ